MLTTICGCCKNIRRIKDSCDYCKKLNKLSTVRCEYCLKKCNNCKQTYCENCSMKCFICNLSTCPFCIKNKSYNELIYFYNEMNKENKTESLQNNNINMPICNYCSELYFKIGICYKCKELDQIFPNDKEHNFFFCFNCLKKQLNKKKKNYFSMKRQKIEKNKKIKNKIKNKKIKKIKK